MSPEQRLAHFERIADAPDAIPRLRRFILDLAVHGKLVAQDASDEPVSVLLERIEAERTRLFKARELKALECSEPIRADDLPFALPSSWGIARMGWLARKLGAGSTPLGGKSVYQREGVPFLRSQNVHDDGLRLDDVALISRSIHSRMSGTHVQQHDILLNITGASIGRCALVPTSFLEGNVSQHVAIIRLFLPELREFLHLTLTSPLFQKRIDDVQVGVSRAGLSMERLRLFPMLLPPLAEQHRIVAKVDELMAWCNRLETAQGERERQRDRLVAASLQRLNQPPEADARMFREHARFHLHNLPRFTARPEHIHELSQTIVNLAVRGQLVPQDPNDEPASELFERIQTEKVRLMKPNAGRRRDPVIPIEAAHSPANLPPGWAWAKWASIALKIGDIDHKMPDTVLDGVPYISPRDFRPGNRIDFGGAKRVSREDFSRLSAKMRPSVGDLIYPRYGTIGESRLVEDHREFLVSYSCALIKVMSGFIDPMYQYLYSVSLCCRQQAMAAENKTTQANVGIRSIQEFVVPLPPLAEQHRIVAKVEELMALCDRLEGRLTTTQTDSRRFLEAVLHRALAPVA